MFSGQATHSIRVQKDAACVFLHRVIILTRASQRAAGAHQSKEIGSGTFFTRRDRPTATT